MSIFQHFKLLYSVIVILLVDLTQEISGNAPPNIIIILADDMGFNDVSFRGGGKEFLTPNIDALAYHGKILDRLYAPSMCTPSRGALLTGRYPIHTGLQHFIISNEEPWALPTNVTTIAEVFRGAGYSTNLVGKWHLGFAKKEYTPTFRGFDYHYGYWGGYIDYYRRRSRMALPNVSLGYDFRRNMALECAERDTYMTDLLTNEAERIIVKNNGSSPLFLLVAHLATHRGNEDNPFQAPEDEIQKFMHITDPERRKYAAMVSRLDTSVGRIVGALDRSGMLKNSIVIFYSDNGAPTAGLVPNTGSNWPLRGQKNSPWEGGVRVAGAVWSPLLKSRGTVWRQPMYVGDWLPTLAAAAGIQLDSALNLDGINLWQQLSESSAAIIQREILHNMDSTWNVISYMLGKWKYIDGSTLNGAFDYALPLRDTLETDPRELYYEIAVKNSLVSQVLQHYDEQHLTKSKIAQLRHASVVNCGKLHSSCNAMLEECLFNIEEDPCEQNNLARIADFEPMLLHIRKQLDHYWASSWPEGNIPGKAEYDPSRHGCTWTNFLQHKPTKEVLECTYFGPPCDGVSKSAAIGNLINYVKLYFWVGILTLIKYVNF